MTKTELSDLFETLCSDLEKSYYGVSDDFFMKLDEYLTAGGKIKANDKDLLNLAKEYNHTNVVTKLAPSPVEPTKNLTNLDLPPLPIVYSKTYPLTRSTSVPSLPSTQLEFRKKKLGQ